MKRRFVFCTAICLLFCACKRTISPQSTFALGTVCTVNAFSDGTQSLYDLIFLRLRQIDSQFSVTNTESDISRINDAAGIQAVPVSDEVFFVIQKALEYARATDGAFDPTVGALVRLWGFTTDFPHVPEQTEIADALLLTDYRKVMLDEKEKSVYLAQKGMALDLGGIVKGYAADQIACILREKHIDRAVIDLGGNVYVFGKKKDGSEWRVGIKNPLEPEASPFRVLSVTECAVVTSGTYERFFEQNGHRYHHIINPRTGWPAESDLLSVTVIDSSSLEADALSTALFVLGQESGTMLAEKLHVRTVFVRKEDLQNYEKSSF